MRILVVDDDAVTLCFLEALLCSWGHEVATADNGRSCMTCQRTAPADVVITDIIMPEQDGLATIAQLRREFPGVKVIAMSGGTPVMDMESAIRTAHLMGADAVLPKPLDTDVLRGALTAVSTPRVLAATASHPDAHPAAMPLPKLC
ncbi:response regulator [Nitratidesulfovibrio sp. D1]|uniref:response regulator n=1 Tax=unclassified Nitratidesulfovibrio TaxID=2802296 RepID=UPI002FDA3859